MKSNGWHSDGASHERRRWGFFCLELLPILPLSLSLTLTHCPSLSLPPSLSRLWNPTAVLIPRILLQGLISFPFLERLFKYCYIYSQQQNSLPPSQAAAEQQRSTDEGEKSRSYSSIPFKFCLSCMSLSLYPLLYISVLTLHQHCSLSMSVIIHRVHWGCCMWESFRSALLFVIHSCLFLCIWTQGV